ncbi:MAG: sulfatase-like hydrolase/transferase [Clostridia bacterium]|nr:sulfatase-like hydrolase/transferase [Clostridia bacterium]
MDEKEKEKAQAGQEELSVEERKPVETEMSQPAETAQKATEEKAPKKEKAKKKKKFFNKERKSRLIPAILIALGVSLLMYIAVPLEMWCNNMQELQYFFSDIIGMLLLCCLLSCCIVFSMLFFVPKKAYKVMRGLVIGGSLMLMLQANYLNFGITSLAADGGQTVAEMVDVGMMIFNTALWVVVVAGCVVASILIKKKKIMRPATLVLAILLFAPQVMSITVSLVSTDFSQADIVQQMATDDPDGKATFLTNKNITTMGDDRNVVVFVIDRFDAERYCEPNLDYIKGKVDNYGGFTYFKDNISMYGHTYPSLAYMATGVEHELDETRKDYFERAYTQNETLTKLKTEGYSINLHTDVYYGYYDGYQMLDVVDNAERVSEDSVYRNVKDVWGLLWGNLKLSLYRTLPMAMKELVSNVSSAEFKLYVSYDSDELVGSVSSTDMKQTYLDIANGDFNKGTNKNFSMIHVSGCHETMYDEDWDNASIFDRFNIDISLKNSFKIIDEYIEGMKQAGVYDNSTIIITGDHSHPVNDLAALHESRMTALFVKPSTESSGEMKTSTAQVSHADLWPTIFQSEGIAYNTDDFKGIYDGEFGVDEPKSVFDVDETENRTRKYYWEVTNRFYTKQFYTIHGNGYDFDNWHQVKNEESKRNLYD